MSPTWKICLLLLVCFEVKTVYCAGNRVSTQNLVKGKAHVAALMTKLIKLRSYTYIVTLMTRSDSTSRPFTEYLQVRFATDVATLLLPTDAAWKKLNKNVQKSLATADARTLQTILRAYVGRGLLDKAALENLKAKSTILTADGSLLKKLATRQKSTVSFSLSSPGNKDTTFTVSAKNSFVSSVVAAHGIDTFFTPGSG